LVPLEAGACRKPVVASNIEGVRETIKDGETGILFKKSSAEDLADKILILYENNKLRISMGEEGYKYVLDNFSREKMIEEYKKLYNSLIKTNVLH